MSARPAAWKVALAFAIVYFVWGSTFLAIRIGVAEVPPFLYAAMRFLAAGGLLFAWTRWRGEAWPSPREWLACAGFGAVFFTLDYGALFWAEQSIPSGTAAVVLALMPGMIALMEIAFLRSHRLTLRAGLGLIAGVAGVAALTVASPHLGAAPNPVAVVVLLLGCLSWSAGTVLTRRAPLPASQPTSAAAQMLLGGAFLVVVAGLGGEFGRFDPARVTLLAWAALAYLVVPGSIVGFTAYLWLLQHESPTRVGTYAYVNPLVAVALGYFFAGEPLGLRTLLGAGLILLGVIAITARTRPAGPAEATEPGQLRP